MPAIAGSRHAARRTTARRPRSVAGLPTTVSSPRPSNGSRIARAARRSSAPRSTGCKKRSSTGQIDTVVVWKLDRISRRQHEGISLLADWCERGIRVVVVTQQIDLSGAVGRMVASVLFGLAEIELEYRRERQTAGIAVAKDRGVYCGRKKGTTKAKPTRARELRDQGLTVLEIANALAVSDRTVFRYLSGSFSSPQ